MKTKQFQALIVVELLLIMYSILAVGIFIILAITKINTILKLGLVTLCGIYFIIKASMVKKIYNKILR